MSEAFIAHACNAFNNAWSSGNSLVVDCQPLTEALSTLSLTVNSLQQEMLQLREQNETLRNQNIQYNSEQNAMKQRISDLSSSVVGLLDDSTGMVGRKEFKQALENINKDQESKLKEVNDVMESNKTLVTRTLDEDRARVMGLIETVDNIRQNQLEGFVSVRQQVVQAENQLRGLNAERCQAHLQLSNKHEEHVNQTASRFNTMKENLIEKIENNRQQAADDLMKNTDELLQHLDRQAQRVDGLQRSVAQRDANIPSKQEIEKVNKQLEDSRFAVEDSQIRLQETFSQCMSLLETSAFGNNNKNNLNTLSSAAGQSLAASTSNALFEQSLNNTRARTTSFLNTTTTSNRSSSGNNNNAGNATPSAAPNTSSTMMMNNNNINNTNSSFVRMFENRLDHIQTLVERILQEELPWLASESKAKHEDHIILVQAQKRAETMLMAICDVCGLGTPENFAAALRMSTVTKAQSIIQGGLKKLLSPEVMEELVSTTPVLSRIREGLQNVFVTSSNFQNQMSSISSKLQNSSSGKSNNNNRGEGDQENDSTTTDRLLQNPAVAAATQRFQQALKNRGVATMNQQQQDQVLLRLGVDIADVGEEGGKVKIMALASKGIAEKSGLQRGDVFVKLDDTEIKNCEQFMMRVQHLDRRFKMESRAKNVWPPKGFSVNAVVLRGGVQKNVTLNLEWTSF